MGADLKERVRQIIDLLSKEYPDAKTALNFSTPLELLVATVLSAQCTDERVNKVTKDLFKRYRSAREYASVPIEKLEEDIRSTGFFRNKAKSIKGFCTELEEKYGGKVPASMEELVKLPGVGRKTANLVLGEAFGIPGIVVDTHFLRLTNRIGLTAKKDPVKVELELMEIVPRKDWTRFSHLLILHGRAVCTARNPKHEVCNILNLCKEGLAWQAAK